jgi:outer membrane protein assembly factor BamD (BamD/ComL family)
MKGKEDNEMRPEYKKEDLRGGVRGKYYEEYKEANNLVRLYPEVAKAFPTEKAVNEALLALIKLAQMSVGLTEGSSRQS